MEDQNCGRETRKAHIRNKSSARMQSGLGEGFVPILRETMFSWSPFRSFSRKEDSGVVSTLSKGVVGASRHSR
jgi:hypothetical protein